MPFIWAPRHITLLKNEFKTYRNISDWRRKYKMLFFPEFVWKCKLQKVSSCLKFFHVCLQCDDWCFIGSSRQHLRTTSTHHYNNHNEQAVNTYISFFQPTAGVLELRETSLIHNWPWQNGTFIPAKWKKQMYNRVLDQFKS